MQILVPSIQTHWNRTSGDTVISFNQLCRWLVYIQTGERCLCTFTDGVSPAWGAPLASPSIFNLWSSFSLCFLWEVIINFLRPKEVCVVLPKCQHIRANSYPVLTCSLSGFMCVKQWAWLSLECRVFATSLLCLSKYLVGMFSTLNYSHVKLLCFCMENSDNPLEGQKWHPKTVPFVFFLSEMRTSGT